MSEETNYFTYFVDPFSVSVSYVEDRIHIFVLHKCIQREYMTTIEEEDFPCFDLKALFVMIKKCLLKNIKQSPEIVQSIDCSVLNKNDYVQMSLFIEEGHFILQNSENVIVRQVLDNWSDGVSLEVKSGFGNESYWIWENDVSNIQLMISNYENSNLFDYYSTHEHHLYVEKIDIIDLLE